MIERRIALQSTTDVAVLLPDIGAGKRTFWRALAPELSSRTIDGQPLDIQVIQPQDGSFLTRASWRAMKELYVQAGKPGRFQGWVGQRRQQAESTGFERLLLGAANREVHRQFSDAEIPIVSFHGLFGQNLPRFLIDADIVPEPKGIDHNTSVLVPTAESAQYVQAISEHQEVHVVGFMMPEVLRDEGRAEQIIDVFSKEDLDPEDPLRVSFLMTGQGAHMEDLENILRDQMVQYWIKTGQMKLDVFMWNHRKKAQTVFRQAQQLELNPLLGIDYNPQESYGVNVYWNPDADTAVDDSIAMVKRSHVFISPPAEKTPFGATTYPVYLDPVKGNAKMEGNLAWLLSNEVAGSSINGRTLSEVIRSLCEDRGKAVEEHFVKAEEVFEGGALLNGAKNTADIVMSSFAKTS